MWNPPSQRAMMRLSAGPPLEFRPSYWRLMRCGGAGLPGQIALSPCRQETRDSPPIPSWGFPRQAICSRSARKCLSSILNRCRVLPTAPARLSWYLWALPRLLLQPEALQPFIDPHDVPNPGGPFYDVVENRAPDLRSLSFSVLHEAGCRASHPGIHRDRGGVERDPRISSSSPGITGSDESAGSGPFLQRQAPDQAGDEQRAGQSHQLFFRHQWTAKERDVAGGMAGSPDAAPGAGAVSSQQPSAGRG